MIASRGSLAGSGTTLTRTCVVVFVASACAEPPRPVHSAAAMEPAPIVEVVARAPERHAEPTPTQVRMKNLKLVRTEGRITVMIDEPVEELIVTSRGLVWTHSGAVWAAFDGSAGVELLARQADPHGLAGDDAALYWAGAERHVRHMIATGEQTAIPGLNPRLLQLQGFAIGPPTVALVDDPVALWRIRWPGPRLDPVRVRIDPGWRRATDLRARGGSLFFSVLVQSEVDTETSIVAVDFKGRSRARRTRQGRLSRGAWDVDTRGVVVFVADGALHRLGTKDEAPTRVLALPDAALVCWCGPRVCSDDASALEIRAWNIHSGAVTTVASEGEPVVRLACGPERVAWATDASIVAVGLP
jgi:hypothetical protein